MKRISAVTNGQAPRARAITQIDRITAIRAEDGTFGFLIDGKDCSNHDVQPFPTFVGEVSADAVSSYAKLKREMLRRHGTAFFDYSVETSRKPEVRWAEQLAGLLRESTAREMAGAA